MEARRGIVVAGIPRSLKAAARYRRCALASALAVMLGGVAGCPPQGPVRTPGDVLDIQDAISLVNSNSLALQTTLKARAGHARGHFSESDGRRRKFDLDAALLVRPPRCLRLDLSVMGKSQLVFGSNNERYWVVQPGADALTWGRHDQPNPPRAGDLIIRPDLIVEAVGIHPLPDVASTGMRLIQRTESDYQQLIFIEHDDKGQGRISKEYWLDRYEPRLVGRVVFRDALGEVVMDSRISDYKQVGADGPFAPQRIEVRWPANDSYMLFTARGWSMLPMVDESHPGFAFPLDRGESFRRIVDIDVALDNARNPAPPPILPPEPECELPGEAPPPALRPLLAVCDFDVSAVDQVGMGDELAEVCRITVGDTNRYVIMDWQDMVSRLDPSANPDASECADSNCLIDFGRSLNVQKLIHGKLEPNGEAWMLTLKMVDTSAGVVEARFDIALVSQPERIVQAIPALTCELLKDALKQGQ